VTATIAVLGLVGVGVFALALRLRRSRLLGLRRERWERAHTLTTERLTIRPMRASDRDEFLATIDDEVRKWQGYDDARVDAVGAAFDSPLLVGEPHGCSAALMICDESGAVVGRYSIEFLNGQARPNLGWWLGPSARGRGLGRESLVAVLGYVHGHLGYPSVLMGTASSNAPARDQIESTGAVQVDHGEHLLSNGESHDAVWYVHSDPATDQTSRPAGWQAPCMPRLPGVTAPAR